MNKLAKTLFLRMLNAAWVQHTNLDDATLGKPGGYNIAILHQSRSPGIMSTVFDCCTGCHAFLRQTVQAASARQLVQLRPRVKKPIYKEEQDEDDEDESSEVVEDEEWKPDSDEDDKDDDVEADDVEEEEVEEIDEGEEDDMADVTRRRRGEGTRKRKRTGTDSANQPKDSATTAKQQGKGILEVVRATSGRATCKGCNDKISNAAWRIGMQSWVGGRQVSVWQHPRCFVGLKGKGSIRVDYAPNAASKCKCTGEKFQKGELRVKLEVGATKVYLKLNAATQVLRQVFENEDIEAVVKALRDTKYKQNEGDDNGDVGALRNIAQELSVSDQIGVLSKLFNGGDVQER
eukprot:gnl/MRDRNA2_/MRDRNA2_61080_c0_seq1.p1 gnl/MRDRNA2_/MRDRNA2_61080_c0~~gnl/MRDRNA2_/MRDRNA2_61080_c0_seq1.p1  ORF type:complete len:347 (-),score=98.85 gnl/MRDRNA2_/MRDRNA2_61080_c0_seq1:10-1050(-)